MGILGRIGRILRARTGPLLGTAEDPRNVLDDSYERLLEHLQDAKRSVVELSTARRRLQLQAARHRDDADRLTAEARAALADGREDLARRALERKQLATQQLRDLEERIADLARDEQKLAEAEARLEGRIEAFRTRKEVLGARHSAAEAQVRVGEAITGLSREMGDVDTAVRQIEERTRQLEARAAAVDELVHDGLLDDGTGKKDRLEREIEQLALTDNVESELASLRRSLDRPRSGEPG